MITNIIFYWESVIYNFKRFTYLLLISDLSNSENPFRVFPALADIRQYLSVNGCPRTQNVRLRTKMSLDAYSAL
jgi:hypothetical protein